ncbi:hypothetical protein M0O54_07465 [Acinetobacter lactucae]|uniref:Uncharacterized protein n=1 Tax=Acinetobacter lactucae TaxID=1785128 RepID=A0AB35K164_9GAMM|nr:hypothetical protein [Acinetobacter lactucae]MDD9319962.1 hypothetical protein [Acinetobacter lactucae]
MIHKTIKPDIDLILARFAIFGVLAILFVASSVNGHPSWLTWAVMLWGVFSIFEAAIKADEALENVIDSQTMIENLTKRAIIQHRIIKYQDQKINQLIEMRGKEIKELKASHHGEMIGHEVHLKQVKKNRDDFEKKVKQLKRLVNYQHKIIKKHDQSLERMLEFKKQIKDHVISLRNEYNLWANEEIPQIEVQLDHLENLIEANSQQCDCTNLQESKNFFNKLIICHQCGKEHLI